MTVAPPSRQSSCDAILSMPRGIGNGEFDRGLDEGRPHWDRLGGIRLTIDEIVCNSAAIQDCASS